MKLTSTLALLGTAALSGAAHADLTVISFGGANQKAQQAAYYEPFAAASGVKIVAGEYNGEQAKIKAMVETKNVTWDVVEVESPELARGCEEGLYEKLDYSKIGNKSDYIGKAVGECGIGTFVWSTVLAYNADKLKQAPTSWADFWDVKRFPGKRGMRKGAKFTLEFALLADGVKPADVYTVLATPAGVDRAFKKLDELKPNIQWWEAGAQPPQMLASGDMVMSSAYNGRIAAAQAEGKNLKIVWNGSVYDVDSWAIPTGSPRIKEAYDFIRFASQAKPQSQYAALIPYGPTHQGAVGMMDAKVAADLPTAPANLKGALPSNTEFWVEYGEDLEQRFNAWAAR
ncbi:ABC transporter substrate-binding protein [Denitromonas iodatirespirans]|uniref:ABC transporter substrate-binding protein n=1 Tax=Denitromonas iodatirespirans TaxID=2795389 RepID=A0A944HA39_DENI1|nr:ABC transporter substrate-binding protein [Denitromonas iodatirespirans]MBT0963085.1 ABC transporter substrate-binding protein [Denitromonas iodatirespirans]